MLVVDSERSRCAHVALGQLRIVESCTCTLNPVEHGLSGLRNVGDAVCVGSKHELVTSTSIAVDQLHLGVEHAASDVEPCTFGASRRTNASVADVSASVDVSVSFDRNFGCVTHCSRNLQVVGDVAWNVVRRDGHRNANPCSSSVCLAEFYAIDEKLEVDKVAFLKSGGCIHSVIFVGAGVEGQVLDNRRCANASNAKVSNCCLLEESLD